MYWNEWLVKKEYEYKGGGKREMNIVKWKEKGNECKVEGKEEMSVR